MKILNYTLALLFTFGLLSCGGGGGSDPEPEVKPDTTAPSVVFENLSKTEPVTEYTAGQSVIFKAKLSDDNKLKSITFDKLSEETTIKTVPQFIEDFNKKLATAKPLANSVSDKASDTVNFSVEIMPTAPNGVYTLTCTVTDNSNNPRPVKLYFKIK